MKRIDQLIEKARERAEPKLTPWEKAMRDNPYVNMSFNDLLDLLSKPRDDWRLIAQACVWRAGESYDKDQA